MTRATLAFLGPIVCNLGILLIQSIASRSRGIPPGEHPEFRVARGMVVFMWMVPAAVALLPLAIFSWHSPHLPGALMQSGAFAFALAVCAAWGQALTLTFWDDHLTYGAFSKTDIAYKDIVSAELKPVGRSGTGLVIRTSGNKRIVISPYLSSQNDAAELLKSKLGRDASR